MRVFPEYTPHDSTRHLDQLSPLADRILGTDVFARLNGAELSLLVFALYAHDWGMAVGPDEYDAIAGVRNHRDARTAISNEAPRFEQHRAESAALGTSETEISISIEGRAESIKPVDDESRWPCITAHTISGDSIEQLRTLEL